MRNGIKDEHKQVEEAANKTSKTKKPAYSAGFMLSYREY